MSDLRKSILYNWDWHTLLEKVVNVWSRDIDTSPEFIIAETPPLSDNWIVNSNHLSSILISFILYYSTDILILHHKCKYSSVHLSIDNILISGRHISHGEAGVNWGSKHHQKSLHADKYFLYDVEQYLVMYLRGQKMTSQIAKFRPQNRKLDFHWCHRNCVYAVYTTVEMVDIGGHFENRGQDAGKWAR